MISILPECLCNVGLMKIPEVFPIATVKYIPGSLPQSVSLSPIVVRSVCSDIKFLLLRARCRSDHVLDKSPIDKKLPRQPLPIPQLDVSIQHNSESKSKSYWQQSDRSLPEILGKPWFENRKARGIRCKIKFEPWWPRFGKHSLIWELRLPHLHEFLGFWETECRFHPKYTGFVDGPIRTSPCNLNYHTTTMFHSSPRAFCPLVPLRRLRNRSQNIRKAYSQQ